MKKILLALVGLEAVMHKRIRKLSGGMRRRVDIAQSLVGDPDLLVLVEATSAVDPELEMRIGRALERYRGE